MAEADAANRRTPMTPGEHDRGAPMRRCGATFCPDGRVCWRVWAPKAGHVELMPVAQFPGGRNWGYDGASAYAAQNSYGGPHGLQRLVDACHAAGLALVLDVVYNHLGPEGNYLAEFGPYFTDHYKTPWGRG